jgi:beta-galactosidase/beta-glucuronidase
MITLFNTNRTKTLFIAALLCLFSHNSQAYIAPENLVLLQSLKGSWQFSIGVNEEWVSPKFNDSDWETIKAPSPWENQGYNGYNGYAFYRKKINIPSNYKGRMLYLNMGYIDDVDEVYLNGHKIGSTGGFPPDYNTAYKC